MKESEVIYYSSDEEEDISSRATPAGGEEKNVIGLKTAAKFSDLPLKAEVLAGLREMEIFSLSPVQEQCLPVTLYGRDLICCAPAGMGKTLVYVLSIVQYLAAGKSSDGVEVLIAVPTKELAFQVQRTLNHFHVRSACFCGGQSTAQDDTRVLQQSRIPVVIGTVGRLVDLVSRRALDLTSVKHFVVDECDQMLSTAVELREQVQTLFTQTPADKQSYLLSATLSSTSLDICRKFIRQNLFAEIRIMDNLSSQWKSDEVQHFFLKVDDREKSRVLVSLLESADFVQMLVFAGSRTRAERLYEDLNRAKFPSAFVHGKMSTEDRLTVYQRVIDLKVRILIATDLYGRGIDCPALDFTVNYDMPTEAEQYIHRVGRVGRGGQKRAVAVSFVAKPEDDFVLGQAAQQNNLFISEYGK